MRLSFMKKQRIIIVLFLLLLLLIIFFLGIMFYPRNQRYMSFEDYAPQLSKSQNEQLKKKISEVQMPHFQCVEQIDFSKGCFTYDAMNGFIEEDEKLIQESIDEVPRTLRANIQLATLACVLHGVLPSDEAVLELDTASTPNTQLLILALDGKELTDKCLDGFVNFKNLKILDLGDTQITQDGWNKLREALPKCDIQPENKEFLINTLEHRYQEYWAKLDLSRLVQITDEDIATLEDVPLEGLNLEGCIQITDQAMDSIAKIKTLRYLNFRQTQVTDTGVAKLLNLPKLEILDISGTAISDAGLSILAKSSNLRKLSLCHTKITGSGFTAFPKTCKIETLLVSGTDVEDNAMKTLGRWHHLKELDISFTKVTRTGLSYVQKWGMSVRADMTNIDFVHGVK